MSDPQQFFGERIPAQFNRALDAQDRSWVGLVAQAGISAFTTWFEHPGEPLGITADVFGTAPRELTRSISLSRTLELVRTVRATGEPGRV